MTRDDPVAALVTRLESVFGAAIPVSRDVPSLEDPRYLPPRCCVYTFGVRAETEPKLPTKWHYDVRLVVVVKFTGAAGECRSEILLGHLDTIEGALRTTIAEQAQGAEEQTSLGLGSQVSAYISGEVVLHPGLGGASGPESLGALDVPITLDVY